MNIYLDRDLMTYESTDKSKVQLDDPVPFIRVTNRSVSARIHIEAEKNLRQLHHRSLRLTKAENPGAHCTDCRLLNMLKGVFSRSFN